MPDTAGYVGQVFEDRYRILRLIGEGGMGAVYEAEHVVVGRRVAIKLLHPELARDVQVVARFYNEARAAGSIGNEHIIEILDFGKNPAPYLVMELLGGKSLSDVLETEGPLSAVRSCALLVQVLEALEAAHAKEIVHRDLKPENIFILPKDGRESIKLLDFGISKLKTADPITGGHLTQTGTVLGTPYYMSPEQALGARDLNHLTDLYSAGVILYECLTGRQPFTAENYNMLLVKIISDQAPAPRTIRSEIPEPLEHIIQKAMAQDRPLRFQTAREFADALRAFLEGRRTGVLPVVAGAGDTAARIAAARARILQGGAAVAPAVTGSATNLAWDGTATGGERPKKSRAIPLAIGATVAVLAVAAVLYFVLRDGGDAGSAPATTPPAAPQQVAPPPAPPAVQAVPVTADEPAVDAVRVAVTATPPEAKIFLDDVELPGNPATARFRKDGLMHKLRVAADGFAEKTSFVEFSADVVLTIRLEAAAEATADAATAEAAPPDAGPLRRPPPVRPRTPDTGTVTPPIAPPPPPPPPPTGPREVDLPTGPTNVPSLEDNPYARAP